MSDNQESPAKRAPTPNAGEEFRAPYPFVRDTYEGFDAEGRVSLNTWRPGVRSEPVPPDSSNAVADGMGEIILKVVSVHRPGNYPTRVFFVRQWRDPTGRTFGKPRLHVATLEKFRRLARGYRHEFELPGQHTEAVHA